jgi:hypothetical protein
VAETPGQPAHPRVLRRDSVRLLAHVAKPLCCVSLGDLQSFARSLSQAGLPAGADESQLFFTAKELAKLTAEWTASRLVNTWNGFAGVAPFDDRKPVKKFTNPKAAVARIWLRFRSVR